MDDCFGVPNQQELNKNWLVDAEDPASVGLNIKQTLQNYKDGGYEVNRYKGEMRNDEYLPWIINEMENDRIVQFFYGTVSGHNVTIDYIKYDCDYQQMYIKVLNPSSASDAKQDFRGLGGQKSIVTLIYSVWYPK